MVSIATLPNKSLQKCNFLVLFMMLYYCVLVGGETEYRGTIRSYKFGNVTEFSTEMTHRINAKAKRNTLDTNAGLIYFYENKIAIVKLNSDPSSSDLEFDSTVEKISSITLFNDDTVLVATEFAKCLTFIVVSTSDIDVRDCQGITNFNDDGIIEIVSNPMNRKSFVMLGTKNVVDRLLYRTTYSTEEIFQAEMIMNISLFAFGHLSTMIFDPEGVNLYMSSTKGIWAFKFSNPSGLSVIVQISRQSSDGSLRESTVDSPSDILFISSNLLLVQDKTSLVVRVVDLIDNRISTICQKNPSLELRAGNISECLLSEMFFLAKHRVVPNSVLIGSSNGIYLIKYKNADINTDNEQDGVDKEQDGVDKEQDGVDKEQNGVDKEQDGVDKEKNGGDEEQDSAVGGTSNSTPGNGALFSWTGIILWVTCLLV